MEVMDSGVLSSHEGMELLRRMTGCPDAQIHYVTSCQSLTPRTDISEESIVARNGKRRACTRGGGREGGSRMRMKE